MDINSVNLVGRLAEDPKYTPPSANKVSRATVRIIVNRNAAKGGPDKYDTIPIVAWGVHADNLAKYAHKGKEIGIIGELRTNPVRMKDGSWNNYWEVMAEKISYGSDFDSKQDETEETIPRAQESVKSAIEKKNRGIVK